MEELIRKISVAEDAADFIAYLKDLSKQIETDNNKLSVKISAPVFNSWSSNPEKNREILSKAQSSLRVAEDDLWYLGHCLLSRKFPYDISHTVNHDLYAMKIMIKNNIVHIEVLLNYL